MENITVSIKNKQIGELFYDESLHQYGFNYNNDVAPISLTMPFKNSTYLWQNKLHPIFDMHMPEGYLFEVFKNYLNKKHGFINDFLIFSYLSANIQSRLEFKSEFAVKKFKSLELSYILQNDDNDTFLKLVKMFLSKNSISGIQPKTIAVVKDKEALNYREYIVKTWGDEYPQLALNEYFCLKAVQESGVTIPHIHLSNNNKFLLVERFNYDKKNNKFLGFEEVLGLMGKNSSQKYTGSYEQVAKLIYKITTDKIADMTNFYKIMVMNYLLKNGDAHLKNFGIIYNDDFSVIKLAPAYDIVNTVAYLYDDKPALTMFGKKVWFGKKDLLKFGIKHCYLSKTQANRCYQDCFLSLQENHQKLKKYIKTNPDFVNIGTKMLDSWRVE
ncbi:MAG: type II toxin-antitoxin system HipA family toxin [Gammaproteobacteria bacterium]|nr:MAG: type II toxin-antitoxin system HipA family toxin [Gammaproteobacteria bacterium]